MLTEPQIQQFGRQILLREVGGKGQEKLLATPIAILGWNEALEVAATYLAAGGSPVHHQARASSGFLHGAALASAPASGPISIGATADATIVIGTGLASRTPQTCAACWALAVAQIAGTSPSPVTAGAFAALLAQRQVLGFANEFSLFEFRDGAFAALSAPRCPEHAK